MQWAAILFKWLFIFEMDFGTKMIKFEKFSKKIDGIWKVQIKQKGRMMWI